MYSSFPALSLFPCLPGECLRISWYTEWVISNMHKLPLLWSLSLKRSHQHCDCPTSFGQFYLLLQSIPHLFQVPDHHSTLF